jgi:hypothetical protein
MFLPFCGKKIGSNCCSSCFVCMSDFSTVADKAPPEYVGSLPHLCKSVTKANRVSDETWGRALRERKPGEEPVTRKGSREDEKDTD